MPTKRDAMEPAFTFTIPSIRDDLELDCRVYHSTRHQAGGDTNLPKKGAIIAHPYAPLGGCYDDHVVLSVTHVLREQGFIVATFNFRGASGSKGNTSWTARAETDDYASVFGFLICYLHFLDSQSLGPSDPASLSTLGNALSPIMSGSVESAAGVQKPPISIILGGYSYGSLVTMNLPEVSSMVSRFEAADKGSAEAEIRLRAATLSRQRSRETHGTQRGRTSTIESSPRSPKSPYGMLCGGEESEPGTRRVSRESRGSIDAVRRSMDRSRKRLRRGLIKNDSVESFDVLDAEKGKLESLTIPAPRVSFLLVSPVLPPLASLATMSYSLSLFGKTFGGSPLDYSKLTQHDTLAIYGEKDAFTSSKKLTRWSEQLKSEQSSLFCSQEVKGAGHFWNEEDGVEQTLRSSIRNWASTIAR